MSRLKKSLKGYTDDFKREAIRLVNEEGRSATSVERDLGLGKNSIYRWLRQYKDDPANAFPGKGHLKPADEAIFKLKKENDILRRERDILKKAVSIFSKDPNRYMVL